MRVQYWLSIQLAAVSSQIGSVNMPIINAAKPSFLQQCQEVLTSLLEQAAGDKRWAIHHVLDPSVMPQRVYLQDLVHHEGEVSSTVRYDAMLC